MLLRNLDSCYHRATISFVCKRMLENLEGAW